MKSGSFLVNWARIGPEPSQNLSHTEFPSGDLTGDKFIGFERVYFELEPIRAQKCVYPGKRDPFVTINESVIPAK